MKHDVRILLHRLGLSLRILQVFLTNFFPDRSHRLVREVQALSSAGHQILILSQKKPYPPEEEQYPRREISGEGVRVIRFDIPSPISGISFVPGRSFISYALALIQAPARLLRIALWWKAEIIHVQELPYSMSALLVAKLMRVPMLLEFRQSFPLAVGHNLHYLKKRLLGRLFVEALEKVFTLIEVQMCLLARRVICISGEEKARLVRLGVLEEKIVVITHLPEVAELAGRDTPRSSNLGQTVIYAGYMDPWRGVDLLLDAFSCLLTELPEARLVLLGGGSSRKSLEAQARGLSLSNNVSFHGWLKPEDAFDMIRAADIAVIPHIVSEMPNKLFTYMHCGKPIVASDFPGVRKVLEETQCGILFRPGDVGDLAEKLKILLLDKALCSKMGANALIAAHQRYNWEIESRKLLEIYSKLGSHKYVEEAGRVEIRLRDESSELLEVT